MDIGTLDKAELFFELRLRGQNPNYKYTTRMEMVTSLRALLEAGGEQEYEDLNDATVANEILVIDLKAEEVNLALSAAEGGGVFENPRRIRTLLSHLNRRTNRLVPLAEGDDLRDVRRILKDLKDHVVKFRTMGEGSVYQASSVVVPASTVHSSHHSSSRHTESSSAKSRKSKVKKSSVSDSEDSEDELQRKFKQMLHVSKSLDVAKWNIKFSGSEGSSVLSFIEDVEDKARSLGISCNMIVPAAVELFEGPAKTWYRSIRKEVDGSWSELKHALRREFLPLDYYDILWEEIRARKQGPNESLGIYVANMTGLFQRMEVGRELKDEDKLSIMLKNLAPFYMEKLALTTVRSIRELKELGKVLEVSRQRIEVYDGPKSKVKVMEPDFALKKRVFVNAIEDGEDSRMYLPVEIFGVCYFGLLDCGATRSIIGKRGWNKLSSLKVPLLSTPWAAVKVANQQRCSVIGLVEFCITLENRTRVVSFLVVPDLPHELILGVDFWRLFGLVPNVNRMTCTLGESDVTQSLYKYDEVCVYEMGAEAEDQIISESSLDEKQKSKKLDVMRGEVVKRLKAAYERAAKYYNLRRRPVDFQVNEVVYRRNFVKSDAFRGFAKKLAPRFIGPFTIKKKVGYRAYLLIDEDGVEDGPWHVNDLKPATALRDED
ncbi:Activity-regulated cytoskeleton associated protein 2 [Frankliniella fusca]|uniref:Activity-regulated cytoskeleton associated protein 2 n=1 Tax=Frankliniella fusca TaxID=407009 RepID=A0AAE1LKS0_9NEOP|nr:Activity-regulated cytoskeleton associated protein 2 [Frankliniella fusca]